MKLIAKPLLVCLLVLLLVPVSSVAIGITDDFGIIRRRLQDLGFRTGVILPRGKGVYWVRIQGFHNRTRAVVQKGSFQSFRMKVTVHDRVVYLDAGILRDHGFVIRPEFLPAGVRFAVRSSKRTGRPSEQAQTKSHATIPKVRRTPATRAARQIRILRPRIADLQVTDVYLDKKCFIHVVYKNNGDTEISATLRQKISIDGKPLPDQQVRLKLKPAQKFVQATERRLEGSADITVSIDAGQGLKETDIKNNVLTRHLDCDAPRILAFNADPAEIGYGGVVTLTWKVENARTVQLRRESEEIFRVPATGSMQVRPKASGKYELIARRSDVKVRKMLSVKIVPVIAELGVSDARVVRGQSVRIRWKVYGAERIRLLPVEFEETNLDRDMTAGFYDDKPERDTEYVLIAERGTEQAERVVKVVVVPPPPEIVRFSSSRSTIMQGSEVQLTWEVQKAERVWISPDVGEIDKRAGDRSVQPKKTTVYTLYAENAGGRVKQSLKVEVTPPKPPVIDFFVAAANPVDCGKRTRLEWEVHGAEKVTLQPLGDRVQASGKLEVSPKATMEYTLVAENAYGTSAKRLILKVKPVISFYVFVPSSAGKMVNDADSVVFKGETFYLHSGVLCAKKIELLPGVGEVGPGTQTIKLTAQETTTYSLYVDGNLARQVRVKVIPRLHIETFSVDRTSIRVGESVRLTWNVVGANQVKVFLVENKQRILLSEEPSGERSYQPETAFVSFALEAQNELGDTVKNWHVVKVLPWIESFTVERTGPASGVLHWCAHGTRNSQTTIVPSIGRVNLCGSQNFRQERTTEYKLTVSNDAGVDVRTVTFPTQLHIASFWAQPGTIQKGGETFLRWKILGDYSQAEIVPDVGVLERYQGVVTVKPHETTTYILRVTGVDGAVKEAKTTVTVQEVQESEVGVAPGIEYFRASRFAVDAGDPVVLEWQLFKPKHVDFEGTLHFREQAYPDAREGEALKIQNIKGSVTVTPEYPVMYMLKVRFSTSLFGGIPSSVSEEIRFVSIEVRPKIVLFQGEALDNNRLLITWRIRGAHAAEIVLPSGIIKQVDPHEGSLLVTYTEGPHPYTLRATNPSGYVEKILEMKDDPS